MKLQLKRKIKRRKRKRSNTQARNGKQVGVGDRVLVAQKRRNKFSTKFQVKQENPDYEEEILSGRKHGGQREKSRNTPRRSSNRYHTEHFRSLYSLTEIIESIENDQTTILIH